MALKLVNSITITTQFGKSRIELLKGDITDLPLEDKVDIVMTSAFRGRFGIQVGVKCNMTMICLCGQKCN